VPTPEYVLQLRRKVGTDLLWLPGATAVVLRETGAAGPGGTEVLLVRRSDDGRWTPVTGIVDPGEHPAVTATREVLEETGVSCEVEALVWVNVTDPVTYVNGDRAQFLDHTFRCRYLAGQAHPADDESSAVAWFPLDALPTLQERHAERIRIAVQHTSPVRR
jgi:8-oxo-dGTP pyrophosphatase MutT (NUDIX family)